MYVIFEWYVCLSSVYLVYIKIKYLLIRSFSINIIRKIMKIYLRAGIYSMYNWSMLMYFMPNQRRVTPVDLVILSERAE